ncbi:SRPBCC family protein [Pseudooceanicola sp. C21-150M6]|uniref:SRPBCC family protein n=1 Tax=Pseudooceanicola sp. C21-150M6 TaxID=3434355 RepID=UPI003D7F5A68
MTVDLMLKLTRTIPAAPEKVFDAWLDPETMTRFMAPGGRPTLSAETDPKVGGAYELVMTNMEGTPLRHWGEYRVIDRPNRLSFTWNSPHAEPDSIVELTFEPVEGGTLVTLTHDRFPSEGSRSGHEGGWTSILELLEAEFA